jgi:hypothetical protein
MNMRFAIALLASLAFVPFSLPTAALADASEGNQSLATTVPAQPQALQACPLSGVQKKLNMVQTSPADCCKGHKGVCGCRAGKIVCCDGTASSQPGCTCHGDEGFVQ